MSDLPNCLIRADGYMLCLKSWSIGILGKQLRKDASHSRQGMAEYLVVFRKWPDDYVDPEPVTHTKDDFPLEIWQRYASPVWFDIKRSDTLQRLSVKEDADEAHIAPLQLEVIRRVLELWTNPGDKVLDPFGGIGSTGYEAVKNGRKFIGIELKESYYQQACKNLQRAEFESKKPEQIDLFKFEKEE